MHDRLIEMDMQNKTKMKKENEKKREIVKQIQLSYAPISKIFDPLSFRKSQISIEPVVWHQSSTA